MKRTAAQAGLRGQDNTHVKKRMAQIRKKYNSKRIAPATIRASSEVKMIDHPVGVLDSGIPGAPGIWQFNDIKDGSAYWNRIGRKVTLTSYSIEGGFIPNSTAQAGLYNDWFVRWLVVYDKQPNGAYPTFGEILTNRDKDGNAESVCLSQFNEANKDRFVVLENKLIHFPNGTLTDGEWAYNSISTTSRSMNTFGMDPFNIRTYRKLPALESSYSASTGGIGDCRTGSLFLMLVHTLGTGVEPPVHFYGTVRCRYVDIN